MEKIDWVIAAVGLGAVLATTLGVVFYEELAGEQDVMFVEMEREVGSVTGQGVGSPFQFMPMDNATGAVLDVVIHHTGTVRNSAGGSVLVEFTDPNGTVHSQTKPFANAGPSPTGTQLADVSFTFDVDFFDVPATTMTTDFASFNATKMWMDNYMVRITITNPTETPNVGATYTYTADLTLRERYFEARLASPDLGTV